MYKKENNILKINMLYIYTRAKEKAKEENKISKKDLKIISKI